MADGTAIEWTDATWNPVTGCAIVSPGCTNCYAMKLAGGRLKHHPSRAGLTVDSKAGPVWNGQVRFNAEQLVLPLRWSRPRKIFVCAHGDLFAEGVPDDWIDQVFAVMALCPQHVFQVLTKRPARMRRYVGALGDEMDRWERLGDAAGPIVGNRGYHDAGERAWPLPNVWLGTSVEDQKRANERIPELLATPAAVRFISAEPLLGPIDLHEVIPDPVIYNSVHGMERLLGWVIVGGESGPGARPMHPDWARSLRNQCTAAGVPFFFKQWGNWIDADAWFDKFERDGIFVLNYGKVWQPPQPLNFAHAAQLAALGSHRFEPQSDGCTLIHVGKKAAGRLLDGVTHDGMPP